MVIVATDSLREARGEDVTTSVSEALNTKDRTIPLKIPTYETVEASKARSP